MDECIEVDDEKHELPYDLPTYTKWDQFAKFYHPVMAGSIDGTDVVAHDKAIIRAARSKYTPNRKVAGDPHRTLMVRHLSHETKESSLLAIFSQFGEIRTCRLVRDIITGKSRGYCFIEFKHDGDMRSALRECRDLVIDDFKIVADNECERTLSGWIPRRFGGGFGGRKESGQLRFGGIERPFRRPLPLNSKPLNQNEHFSTGLSFDNKGQKVSNDNNRSKFNSGDSRHHKRVKR